MFSALKKRRGRGEPRFSALKKRRGRGEPMFPTYTTIYL
jgi:hypothetical protein